MTNSNKKIQHIPVALFNCCQPLALSGAGGTKDGGNFMAQHGFNL